MERSNGVDIENPYMSLANSIKTQLNSLPPLSSVCTISRVPDRLRLENEKAYTPQVISIGPFHHGKDSLKKMEEHKMRYLRDHLRWTNGSLENYIEIIKVSEYRLRSCYAETIGFSSDEFVKIILVDSAFIIQLLLRFSMSQFQDEHDQIFKMPWMLEGVRLDLSLFENQLPFFILEELCKLLPVHIAQLSIIEFSYEFFTKGMDSEVTEEKLVKIKTDNVAHFVDFLRKLYIPSNPLTGGKWRSLAAPSVTELHRAGVKFRVASSKNLFDINFHNGILEIPKLTISDETQLILSNLIAFEQCHCLDEYSNDKYLNDFVVIMDHLLNTPNDVDLLVKHAIVENLLGDSSEVAILINKLANGVTMDPNNFYFQGLCSELNGYYRSTWHHWKKTLMTILLSWKKSLIENYFSTPWKFISVIAATLLLVLTIIQAVCSIISVKK